MNLLTISTPKKEQMTTVTVAPGNTTLLRVEYIREESLYILIPLGLLLAVIILSLLVCFMASNRRCCNKRQRRLILYQYNECDSTLGRTDVEEEIEVDSEDNPAKSLLRGKLQINNRFENYLSTSQLSRSFELLT